MNIFRFPERNRFATHNSILVIINVDIKAPIHTKII